MGNSPLRTVQQAFAVVETLWNHGGVGPTELASRMDLPKSTAHEYLRALEATEFVIKRDGVYHVSHRFLTIGGRLKYRNQLFQVAKRELRALAEDTGETTNVSFEENKQWVLLHTESGDRSLDLGTYPGMMTPLHSHAAGKAQLAYRSEAFVDDFLNGPLEQPTEATITDAEELRAELQTIREVGYAVDWDQQIRGMGVVAAPLIVNEDAIGAVAVVCPTGRLQDEEYRAELIRKVQEVADSVTVNYRYGSPST